VPYLIYDPETPDERVHKLRFGANLIGREWDNSIFVGHVSLSRYHAEISLGYDRITITDLHSRNGTFVNEVKIDRCELKDGDWIRCGNVFFKFVVNACAVEQSIRGRQSNYRLRHFTRDLRYPSGTPRANAAALRVRQELPAKKSAPFSILKQASPQPNRTSIRSLLDSKGTDNSLIRLQEKDTAQRTVDKLKILLEVSKQLSSPEEPDRLLEKILDLLFEIMKVDRAAILMVNELTGYLERQAVKLRLDTPADGEFYSRRITNFVRASGEAILTTDACIDQRFTGSDSIIGQTIHASMCVPLKPREEVIGVLYVDNLSMSNVYSDEDLEFLTALANQAAIAIDNAQLYKKMQEEAVIRDKLERFFPETVSRKLREEGYLEIVEAEVTALFADISGFTKLSSTMQPREVIEMLNEYFKVMVEDIVFPYEGTLEKYIGDALLAIWGAPYPKADDTQRAVRAAIEMQWAVCRLMSFVNKFSKFIEEILLPLIPQAIVIFVDEIDSVLSLKFNIDDFFAVIRDCYNKRAAKPDYRRLTFALIGVATPSDLIQDKRRTPFNIGRAIELTGFQLEEAQPLAVGLAKKVSNPEEVLRDVLAWTGGQPFLTQKLCQLVVQQATVDPPQPPLKRREKSHNPDWVEELVQKRVVENWEAQDEPEHLRTIRDRILFDEKRASRLLGLYQQVLSSPNSALLRGGTGDEGVPADDTPEQAEQLLEEAKQEKQEALQLF
jgi:adenylate cyclase